MNRTELERALKTKGEASISLSNASMLWTTRSQFKKWAKEFGVLRYKDEGETLKIQSGGENPACQRGGPIDQKCVAGEVRMLLSLDGQSFQWLCVRCFKAEVEHRKHGGFYNHGLWRGPQWKDAKLKPEPQKAIQN